MQPAEASAVYLEHLQCHVPRSSMPGHLTSVAVTMQVNTALRCAVCNLSTCILIGDFRPCLSPWALTPWQLTALRLAVPATADLNDVYLSSRQGCCRLSSLLPVCCLGLLHLAGASLGRLYSGGNSTGEGVCGRAGGGPSAGVHGPRACRQNQVLQQLSIAGRKQLLAAVCGMKPADTHRLRAAHQYWQT